MVAMMGTTRGQDRWTGGLPAAACDAGAASAVWPRGGRCVRRAAGVALAVLLSGCAGAGAPVCKDGLGSPAMLFTLFLGRSVDRTGAVTDNGWRGFVRDTLGPALPSGYTLMDATGAWQNPRTGASVQEGTRVLVVVLPDVPASVAAVDRVRNEYQKRFHQQLVGMTVEDVCSNL
jgi:hypothetical protein